jgi:two-component system, chemotaxis family, protein-glutamate methylesterase/glutaminase
MAKKIRVLVVDDSAFMRKSMKQILETDPMIEVIGTARDGEDSIIKARELCPDVTTMDINMPGMDGITALQHIVTEEICPVLMVSSLTHEGAAATFEALELGAFDYVPKPGGTISFNLKNIAAEMILKIKLASKSGVLKRIKKRVLVTGSNIKKLKTKQNNDNNIEFTKAVAIGISTGGPQTLMQIIPLLPEDLNAAVFIVQHMPPNFTLAFAKRLDTYSRIGIKEAESGDLIQNSSGYLAKGGYHLMIRSVSKNENRLRLTTIPEHLFIPSVDIMMESVLKTYGKKTVGVLLTGMGDDGANAMVNIRKTGGITIAESEESAIVFGMPQEAIKRGGAEIIAPAHEVAQKIIEALKRI